MTGYQHSVGTFTLLVECHGSSYNNSVCEGDDQDTLLCLISCEDECGYNDDYDNVNIELDVLDCLYSCAEELCGIRSRRWKP